MSIPSATAEHLSAGLKVFAARMFQRGEVTGSYYETLMYYSLSFREHTRKVSGNRVQEVEFARFSK